LRITALAAVLLAGAGVSQTVIRIEIWYDEQSTQWTVAVPVGNGRLGAMVFGGTDRERIQFNDITLWTGGDNLSGGYDVNEFGAYQNFGDLFIELDGAPAGAATGSCASGHVPFNEPEGAAAASDGNAGTKWCVEPKGKDVVWQIELPEAEAISSYAFTSGNDVPERDPQQWRLEAMDRRHSRRAGRFALDAQVRHAPACVQ